MKKVNVAALSEKFEPTELLKRLQTASDYKQLHSMDMQRQFHLQKDKEDLEDQREKRVREINLSKRVFVRKYHKYLFKNKHARKDSNEQKNDSDLRDTKLKLEVHLPSMQLERESTFFSSGDSVFSESETEDENTTEHGETRKHRKERRQRSRSNVLTVKPISLSLPEINENSVFSWNSGNIDSEVSSGTERTPTPRERERSNSIGDVMRQRLLHEQITIPPMRDRSKSLVGLSRSRTQLPSFGEKPQPYLKARSQSFHTIDLLQKMDKNDVEKKVLRRMSQSYTGMLKFKYFAKLMTHSIKELKEELPDPKQEEKQGLYKEMAACRYLRVPSEDR